jgi:hypothetical protein
VEAWVVEIQFSVPDRVVGEVEWHVVASMRVDGTDFELEGDQDSLEVRDIEVLDVQTGQSVTFDADPERWARNLPQAFRSGDLVCEIVGESAAAHRESGAIAAGA